MHIINGTPKKKKTPNFVYCDAPGNQLEKFKSYMLIKPKTCKLKQFVPCSTTVYKQYSLKY